MNGINQTQMQTRGRGSKNPKILWTSYLGAPRVGSNAWEGGRAAADGRPALKWRSEFYSTFGNFQLIKRPPLIYLRRCGRLPPPPSIHEEMNKLESERVGRPRAQFRMGVPFAMFAFIHTERLLREMTPQRW